MTNSVDKIVGCGAVNEHISKPIPKTLWHYTSFRGLQGIVSSKSIWATEYRFLNDRKEFLHAKGLAETLIDEEPEFGDKGYPAREILRKFVVGALNTGYLHEERLRVMVASFTEEGDQLSQWRGYADGSRGVSIGLDVRHLRPSDIHTPVTFAPCLYKPEDKRTLLKSIFAHHRKGLDAWRDSVFNLAQKHAGKTGLVELNVAERLVAEHQSELHEAVVHANANLRFDLLRAALLLKHESFSEEREWRLVLPSERIHVPTHHEVKFRYTHDALVPYVEYPLRLPNQEGPIACQGVTLGPGSHPSAAVGVNMFLQTQEIPSMATLSKIPYRPT